MNQLDSPTWSKASHPARMELDVKIMMREMNNSMLDASIIINKYGEKCELLLAAPEKGLLELKKNRTR